MPFARETDEAYNKTKTKMKADYPKDWKKHISKMKRAKTLIGLAFQNITLKNSGKWQARNDKKKRDRAAVKKKNGDVNSIVDGDSNDDDDPKRRRVSEDDDDVVDIGIERQSSVVPVITKVYDRCVKCNVIEDDLLVCEDCDQTTCDACSESCVGCNKLNCVKCSMVKCVIDIVSIVILKCKYMKVVYYYHMIIIKVLFAG